MIFNDSFDIFFILIGTACFVVPLMFIYGLAKRNRARKLASSADDIAIGTARDLEEAESRVQTQDLRAEFHERYNLLASLSTYDGHSESYLRDLCAYLSENGIESDFIFQQTLPLGVGPSLFNLVGTYDLFVEKGKSRLANELVEKFKCR